MAGAGAALGMLAGAVGTGLLLREARKRENEQLGQEAFIRDATHKYVMDGIQNGTLDPDSPGVQGMLQKVYKDKDVSAGIMALAKETFQPGSAARQGIFSPYKTLPEGVGPTIYMPDQLSPQEINQEYQNRINKNPALLAVANPKAYSAMAQQTQASNTAAANTQTTVTGANQRAVYNQTAQDTRQEDQQAFEEAQQGRRFKHEDEAAATKSAENAASNTSRNTLSLITALKDQLPSDISMAELQKAVSSGVLPPQLQRRLGPSVERVKAIAASNAAAQKYVADIGIDKSFAALRKTFNDSARAKIKLSPQEKDAQIAASRQGLIDRAMAGIDGVDDQYLMPVIKDVVDKLPVFFDGELLNVEQVRGVASLEPQGGPATMLLDQIEAQLTQALNQRMGGQRQAPPGTPEASQVPGAPGSPPRTGNVSAYGESPEQMMERFRVEGPGNPPPPPGKSRVQPGFSVVDQAAQTPSPASPQGRAESNVSPMGRGRGTFTRTPEQGPPMPKIPAGYYQRKAKGQTTPAEDALVKQIEDIAAKKNQAVQKKSTWRAR